MSSIEPMQPIERFKLTDSFLSKYKDKQPAWGPLGEIVYRRTYSRPLPDGGNEEFWQTLKRVVEGTYNIQKQHCERYRLPWSSQKAARSAQTMYQLMWEFKFLPPGRGLWAMGTPMIEQSSAAALHNCSFISTEDLDKDFSGPFCFMMNMMMLGVGCGGDTRGAGVVKIRAPEISKDLFIVEDSREGWVALLHTALESYMGNARHPSNVDYSRVRPAGTPIKGFGGTASGPGALQDLIADVDAILRPLIGSPITSTAIVDLFNVVGRCVVAGNVRRSAELILGDSEDKDFLSLKDPARHSKALRHHRWASNNSIFAKVGMNYQEVANQTSTNGEPGYLWLENAQCYRRLTDPKEDPDLHVGGCNPCGEMVLHSAELCCLVECFPTNHSSLEEWKRTLKFAYLYGKTVTLLPTHNERTNAVQLKNRRLGVSQAGIVQSIKKHGLREHFRWCDEGYKYLEDLDKLYSGWLCIPRSIRLTTVKPGGSIPLLVGATPGIHFPHSEYYIRNIRFGKNSPLIEPLKDAGYSTEEDITSPDTTVVSFPIHEQNFSKAKADVSMWEQLELAAQMQHWWSDNAVSVTVTIKPDEAKDLARALELYETRLKSVSFLPLQDHGYAQAPYITISKSRYEELVGGLRLVNFAGVGKAIDMDDNYCSGDKCSIEPVKEI